MLLLALVIGGLWLAFAVFGLAVQVRRGGRDREPGGRGEDGGDVPLAA